MRIHHVGIAVRHLEGAAERFAALGLPLAGTETVDAEGVRIAFLRAGDVNLELLEAIRPDSPIARFLGRRGEGVHHIAFATDDIAASIRTARSLGFDVLDEAPRVGHGGRKVAFIHPRSAHGVLLELVQDLG